MSTFILEANDTIVMSDSVVMKFTESANACLSCAKESATNWADLEITKWIMCGIAVIVAICMLGYIIVKLIDVCSKACQERKKKEWEEKEADRKRDRELLDKKLEIMKALCYKDIQRKENNDGVETEKWVKVLKSYSNDESENIKNYLSALEGAQQNSHE